MKKLLSKLLLGLLLFMQIIPCMTVNAEEAIKGTVQITDETQLEPYFPDPVFRAVVFKAVKDGNDGAEGDDVEKALYNFRGRIKYNGLSKPKEEKIKDVHGIEYLRNAEYVYLKYNEIQDFSFLDKPTDSKEAPVTDAEAEANKRYYGELLDKDPDIEIDAKNVVWDIAGNPISQLPSTFGGRLIILQPGSSSYTYPQESDNGFIFMRPTDGSILNGSFQNINKTKIYLNGMEKRPAEVIGVEPYYNLPGDTNTGLKIDDFSDTTADYSGIIKGGTEHLSVGEDKEIKYSTQDDQGGGAITEGSQSLKYYMTYTFRVYDRITVSDGISGIAELTKTDKDTHAPIKDAVYGVYKSLDDTLVSEWTTDETGYIKATGLTEGDYYFKEITAPAGYKLNPDKVPFTIKSLAGTPLVTSVQGGENEITTTDGNIVTANTGEVLFSGGMDGTGSLLSPDITLSSSDAQNIKSVEVTYSSLEVNGSAQTNVIRRFDTLTDAQTDINNEKALEVPNSKPLRYDTHILGPVSVKVYYENAAMQEPAEVTTTNEAIQTVEVNGQKIWSDYNNGLGTRPDSITINLLQNGTKIDSAITGADNDWKYSFKNLTQHDPNGKDYIYTVEEDIVPADYTAKTDNNNITNTLDTTKNNIIEISGEKKWVDYNNGFQTRPDSVNITLNQNGTAFKNVDVTARDGWKYSFKELPKVDANGTVYTYTVSETKVPAEYTSTVDADNNITNTLDESVNKAVVISGEKTWVDFNNALNTRPENITLKLYRSGQVFDEQSITAADNWEYSFTHLPKFDADGNEYLYTVKEDTVPAGYTSNISGTTITNKLDDSYNNIIKVDGKKLWVDQNNADKTRPDNIVVDLYQNAQKYQSKTVTASDNWLFSFASLPKYDADGKEYVYSVKEAAVAKGYTSDVKGYDITNTLTSLHEISYSKGTNTGDSGNVPLIIFMGVLSAGTFAWVWKRHKLF